MTLVELAVQDAKLDEFDLEGVLTFSQHGLHNGALEGISHLTNNSGSRR
jgi:hypothetical protein